MYLLDAGYEKNGELASNARRKKILIWGNFFEAQKKCMEEILKTWTRIYGAWKHQNHIHSVGLYKAYCVIFLNFPVAKNKIEED